LKELKQWVTESFENVPSKPTLAARQDFSKIAKPGFTELPKSKLPFNNKEMILFNSIQDENKLNLVYQFEADYETRTTFKIYSLIN
jgi:hypothetical protein